MAKTTKQSLGQKGEQLAERYLNQKGFKTIGRNFRYGHGEIDLIVQKDDLLAFVEVKSFRAQPLDVPELRVNKTKQRKLIETAYGFLAEHPQFEFLNLRFDVIMVDFSIYPARLTHYPAAFWLEGPYLE